MSLSTDTIECANCGTEVDGRGDTPQQRIPCNSVEAPNTTTTFLSGFVRIDNAYLGGDHL